MPQAIVQLTDPFADREIIGESSADHHGDGRPKSSGLGFRNPAVFVEELSMIRSISVALMTALAVPASAAIVAFSGTQSNDTPPPGPNPACAAGQVLVQFDPGNSTSAGLSNFGAFGASARHCISLPPTTYSGGVFSYDFAVGDELSGTYSGFFTQTGTPMLLRNVVDYVVTGGTGRFLGASGTFQGVGTLDRRLTRPLSSLTLSGRLDLPAVPEPATWGMMIAGFGLVGRAARRRRSTTAAAS